MSKGGLVTLFGFVLLVTPFLGIPMLAKTIVTIIGAVIIMLLGVLMREERRWLMRAISGDHEYDAYTENGTREYAAKAKQEKSV